MKVKHMKLDVLRKKVKELKGHEESEYFRELAYWLKRRETEMEMLKASKVQGKKGSKKSVR